MPLLPLDVLHVLAEQLDARDLEQALLLLKLFIILCRWVPVVFTVGGHGAGARGRSWHITGTSPIIHSSGTLRT